MNFRTGPRLLFLLGALFAPLAAWAQTFALTTNARTLNPAGGQITFTVVASLVGTGGYGLTIDLPPSWAYISGTDEPSIKPSLGSTVGLDWATINPVSGSTTFSFVVAYPANSPNARVAAHGVIRPSGSTALFSTPPPLFFRAFHSADLDADGRISLAELLRVIALYNHRVGTVRLGAYRTDSSTEDGFASGAGAIEAFHSADLDRDGRLRLTELTRLLELFSTREGGVRTGRYSFQSDSEDGFASDPAPASIPAPGP